MKIFLPIFKRGGGGTLMILIATPILWHVIRKVYLPDTKCQIQLWSEWRLVKVEKMYNMFGRGRGMILLSHFI